MSDNARAERIERVPSSLEAFFTHKCPRCRRGPLYNYPTLTPSLKKLTDMHTHCPHCGLKFEREPGFFWGAMYFTYAFNVALFLVVLFVLRLGFNDPPIWVYLTTVTVATLVLFPFFLRYARNAMLYVFGGVKFDRNRFFAPPASKPEGHRP